MAECPAYWASRSGRGAICVIHQPCASKSRMNSAAIQCRPLAGHPKRGPCCEPLRARRLFFVLAAASILRWAAEFVRTGESLGRKPPGVGAIAAPIGELLDGQCKRAFGGVDPDETARRRERR